MSKKILKFGQILINFAELLPKKYIKGILAYFRRDVRNYLLRSIFLKKKDEYHPCNIDIYEKQIEIRNIVSFLPPRFGVPRI